MIFQSTPVPFRRIIALIKPSIMADDFFRNEFFLNLVVEYLTISETIKTQAVSKPFRKVSNSVWKDVARRELGDDIELTDRGTKFCVILTFKLKKKLTIISDEFSTFSASLRERIEDARRKWRQEMARVDNIDEIIRVGALAVEAVEQLEFEAVKTGERFKEDCHEEQCRLVRDAFEAAQRFGFIL